MKRHEAIGLLRDVQRFLEGEESKTHPSTEALRELHKLAEELRDFQPPKGMMFPVEADACMYRAGMRAAISIAISRVYEGGST